VGAKVVKPPAVFQGEGGKRQVRLAAAEEKAALAAGHQP
jgi:hypothetical protein